jgi:hypothetical protein
VEIINRDCLSRERHQGVRIWSKRTYFQSEKRERESKLWELWIQIVSLEAVNAGCWQKDFTIFSRRNKAKSMRLGRDQQTSDAFVKQLWKMTRNFLHVCPSVCPFYTKKSDYHRADFPWYFTLGYLLNFVETFRILFKIWQNGSYLTWSVVITGLCNSEIIFPHFEFTPKKYLSHKLRAWSIVNLHHRYIRDIDCKTRRLGGIMRLKRDGTCAETRFRLSPKGTSPFKSARGRQFSRLLAAELCAAAVVMLDTCSEVVWRVLATHSIRQFHLHFPSRASPCAITFQLDSNRL